MQRIGRGNRSGGAELMAWLKVGLYIAVVFVTLPFTPPLWLAFLSYSQVSFPLIVSLVLFLPFTGCAFLIFRQNRPRYQIETEKEGVALRRGDTARGRHGDGLQVPASPCSRVSASLFWRVGGLLLLAVLSLLIIIFFAETSAETLHLLEYGGLSYLTLRAAKPYTYRAYLFCLLFVLLVGSVDEGIQFILPNRIFPGGLI